MSKFIALVLLAAPALHAQGEMVSLSGWRTMAGDDARWAAPDFDDSAWQPIPALLNLGSAKVDRRSVPAVTWYRTAFRIPAWWSGRELAVGVWKLDDAYEIFANGVKIGELGSLPPAGSGAGDRAVTAIGFRYRAHVIPVELSRGGEIRIAIRQWSLRGGIAWEAHDIAPVRPSRGEQVIGRSATVTQAGQILTYRNHLSGLPGILFWIAILVCGLLCIAKWNRENSNEFLWLGLALLGSGAYWPISLPMHLADWPAKNSALTFATGFTAVVASNLFFGWFLAELVAEWRQPLRWVSVPIAAGIAVPFVSSFYSVPDWTVATAVRNASLVTEFAICVAAAWVVWRSGRSMLLPIIGGVAIRAGVLVATSIWNPANFYNVGPFVLSLRRTSEAVIAMGLVWVLHARTRADRARRIELARDIDAARRIQETLMGAEDAETPGFAVGSPTCPRPRWAAISIRSFPPRTGRCWCWWAT